MTTQRATFGIILIIIGMVFLLNSLDIMDFGELVGYMLPLGLIALGVWLIMRRKQQEEAAQYQPSHQQASGSPAVDNRTAAPGWGSGRPVPPEATAVAPGVGGYAGQEGTSTGPSPIPPPPPFGSAPRVAASGVHEDGKLRYSKILGELSIDLRDQAVQNVEVSLVAGDIEVRLYGARLEPGLSRMIVSNFLGDIRILVPIGIQVFAHCSNFIGDVDALGRNSSGIGNNVDAQTGEYNAAERRLYIAANSFIGDIKILYV